VERSIRKCGTAAGNKVLAKASINVEGKLPMHDESKIKELIRIAKDLRKQSLRMITNSGAGHPGGSLSVADIIAVLYFHEMRVDPKNPNWGERDRLVLSKGHASPPLYVALAMRGFFGEEHLMTFDFVDSILQGHPDMKKTPGIDMSSGSLGQGLSCAQGIALGGKLLRKQFRVYVILGDGECQEGQVWEAAMSAPVFKLDNLTAIIDYNQVQLASKLEDSIPLEPIADKWKSFGWNVITIDGHKIQEILSAIDEAKACKGKPSVIIARTIKGRGVSFMEHKFEWHAKAPTPEELQRALSELDASREA
jgi:transketolase